MASIEYKKLNTKHECYDAEYWEACRLLYSGGRALLGNKGVLSKVFYRRRSEKDAPYMERLQKAYYVNYAGSIIDHIVAGLFQDPVTVDSDELPEFYDEFLKDCSPLGGAKQSFSQLLKQQVTNALICRRWWTLVDLPSIDPEQRSANLSDQEKSGALNAYALAIPPECVIDWEEYSNGALAWVLVKSIEKRRASLDSDRETITERYQYWDELEWRRYEISYRKDRPPIDSDPVQLVAEGKHSFGKVPISYGEVPDGLWAMNKLEGLAREHLNKRCALSHAEDLALMPNLYEFLGAENPLDGAISAAQQDTGRWINQTRGVGYVQARGSQDRVEYIGPDSTPFAVALASCNNLRDEMYRVLHQMALSVDASSAAAIGRSGESKAQDKAATVVVLRSLGQLVRDHAQSVLDLVNRGRGDGVEEFTLRGMERFESDDLGQLITEAQNITLVDIPSATFKAEYYTSIASSALRDLATPEVQEQIKAELEMAYASDLGAGGVEEPQEVNGQGSAEKDENGGVVKDEVTAD
jgi:hypothetical protein